MKKGFVIHHSASTDGETRNWDRICQIHVEQNGWAPPCGYHFGVELVTMKKAQVMLGREPHRDGAHCPGMNQTHLGLCVVGNFEEVRPSVEVVALAEHLVREAQRRGWVGLEVIPHRNRRATLCPGKYLIEAFSERGLWTEPPK